VKRLVEVRRMDEVVRLEVEGIDLPRVGSVGSGERDLPGAVVDDGQLRRLAAPVVPSRDVRRKLGVHEDVFPVEADVLGGHRNPVGPLDPFPQGEGVFLTVGSAGPLFHDSGTKSSSQPLSLPAEAGLEIELHHGPGIDAARLGAESHQLQSSAVLPRFLPWLHHQRIVGKPLLDGRQFSFRHPIREHGRLMERRDLLPIVDQVDVRRRDPFSSRCGGRLRSCGLDAGAPLLRAPRERGSGEEGRAHPRCHKAAHDEPLFHEHSFHLRLRSRSSAKGAGRAGFRISKGALRPRQKTGVHRFGIVARHRKICQAQA